MTRSQIIAELRRAAEHDPRLLIGEPFTEAVDWKRYDEKRLLDLPRPALRTFYLLVAAAMEAQ